MDGLVAASPGERRVVGKSSPSDSHGDFQGSGAVQVAVIGGGFHDLDDRHKRLDRYVDAIWVDEE